MQNSVFRLFKFEYLSQLSEQECAERLTMDYKDKLIKEGRLPEFTPNHRWNIYIRPRKKGGVLVSSSSTWGANAAFYFRVYLQQSDQGTTIRCIHNPFNFTALGFLGAIALLGLVGLIYSMATGNAKGIVSSLIPLTFLPICVALEYFARRAFTRYLEEFLEARPR